MSMDTLLVYQSQYALRKHEKVRDDFQDYNDLPDDDQDVHV